MSFHFFWCVCILMRCGWILFYFFRLFICLFTGFFLRYFLNIEFERTREQDVGFMQNSNTKIVFYFFRSLLWNNKIMLMSNVWCWCWCCCCYGYFFVRWNLQILRFFFSSVERVYFYRIVLFGKEISDLVDFYLFIYFIW